MAWPSRLSGRESPSHACRFYLELRALGGVQHQRLWPVRIEDAGQQDFLRGREREGLLLKGRDRSWEIIDLPRTTQDLWSLAWFNDRLYLSGFHSLFSLGRKGLAPVNTKPEKAKTFHRLAVGDGRLLPIGAKDVLAFDGEAWIRID